ncbi:TPR-like protein [Dacryopinax primogenitus]|uniref:RNA polymerase II-associated protein 3 n=1 Tax=Dacryopinax primogenitus (strain DJM 731) TaxID=1858805 RepID=M5G3B0_DACPD|nr:TPR-like protein [Dacryopinax primogenitus]EJU03179.1 TPR-like protein [Dacryopinax primogenitus]
MSTPSEAKENGNKAFKAGQYDIAVGHYTRAVVLSQSSDVPVDPVFYLNRAAAYLKLEKYEDAARDCTLALGLKREVKALFRRAQARLGAGDERGAREDLDEALLLEPMNQAVKLLLSSLTQPTKEKTSATPSNAGEHAAPSTSSPRRRRIPITLVDTPSSAAKPLKSALKSSSAPVATPAASTDLLTAVSTTRLTHTPVRSSALVGETSSATSAPAPSFAAAKATRERRVGGGMFKADGTGRIIGSPGPGQPQLSTSSPKSVKEVVERPPVLAEEKVVLPSVPKRASEFVLNLRELGEHARWAYLQLIPPANLPVFFGSALEPDTLSSLIHVLSSVTPPRPLVAEYLRAIPRCARFGTMRLFLGAGEEEMVRGMVGELGDEGLRKEWGF